MTTPVRRMIALLTITAYLCTQSICPLPEAQAASGSASEVAASVSFVLDIPSDLGTVEALSSGEGPTLIHIQTAHGNYEAQKKIQSLLHFLKDRYGVKTLFIEGGASKLDPEMLNYFPHYQDKTLEANDLLTRKALVKGPELFLLEEPEASAWGIEDAGAYRENLASFREVLRQKEQSLSFAQAMDMQIERLTAPFLNKDLRSVLRRVEAYELGQVPFEKWLDEVRAMAAKYLKTDLGDPAMQIEWPMMVRIFKLHELEKAMDRSEFGKQKEIFLGAVQKVVGKPQASRLEEALSGLETGSPEQASDLRSLFETLTSVLPRNFDYRKYPQVTAFVAHAILQGELLGELVAEEVGKLQDRIVGSLTMTQEEEVIVTLLKEHRLLKKLFELELTPSDYQTIAGLALKPSALCDRIAALNTSGRVRDAKFENLESVDLLFDKALEFYAGTHKRDEAMLRNIEARLKETGERKAVVITGGFHAGPFRVHFRDKHFNYALVTPKLTSADGRETYLKAILGSAPFAPSTIETRTLAASYASGPELDGDPRTVLETVSTQLQAVTATVLKYPDVPLGGDFAQSGLSADLGVTLTRQTLEDGKNQVTVSGNGPGSLFHALLEQADMPDQNLVSAATSLPPAAVSIPADSQMAISRGAEAARFAGSRTEMRSAMEDAVEKLAAFARAETASNAIVFEFSHPDFLALRQPVRQTASWWELRRAPEELRPFWNLVPTDRELFIDFSVLATEQGRSELAAILGQLEEIAVAIEDGRSLPDDQFFTAIMWQTVAVSPSIIEGSRVSGLAVVPRTELTSRRTSLRAKSAAELPALANREKRPAVNVDDLIWTLGHLGPLDPDAQWRIQSAIDALRHPGRKSASEAIELLNAAVKASRSADASPHVGEPKAPAESYTAIDGVLAKLTLLASGASRPVTNETDPTKVNLDDMAYFLGLAVPDAIGDHGALAIRKFAMQKIHSWTPGKTIAAAEYVEVIRALEGLLDTLAGLRQAGKPVPTNAGGTIGGILNDLAALQFGEKQPVNNRAESGLAAERAASLIGTRDQERAELRSGFEDHFKGFFPLSLGISTVAFLSFVAYRTYPDRWNGELLWNLLITSPCWLLSVGMIAGILASVLAGVTSLFWPDPFPEEKGPELMDDWERAYRDGMGDGPFEYRPEDEEPPAAPRPELRGVAERAEARISNAVTFDFTREISELRRQFSALDPAIEGILDRATAIQRKGYPLQALRILQPMADLQMSLPEDFMGVFGPLVRRFEDYLSVTELAEMHRQVSMQRLSARAFEQLAGHEKGKESPDGSSAGRTAFNDLEKAVNGFKTNFGGRAARLPAAVAARGREFVTLLDRAVGYAARGRGWYLGSLDILDEVIAQKIKEGDNGFWQCLGTEELDLLESAVMLMSRSEKRERDYGKIAGRTIFSVVLSSLAAAVIGSFFYPLSINLITFLSWFAGTAVLSWTAVGIVVLVLKLSDGIRAIPGLVKQTALKLSVWSKTSTQLKAYPLEDRAVISSVIRGLIRPDHSLEQLIREIPLIAKAAKQLNHTGHPVTLEHWARAIEILREGNDFELVWHPAQTHQGWFVDQVGYNLETQAAYSVSRSGPMSEADARREEASSNGWAGAVSDIIVDREAYLEVKPATRAEIRANGPATPNNWQMPTERFGEGKTVMVAGGAGYIGSMTSWMYHRLGYKVVVYDSLTTGHRGALPEGVTFVEGDISDGAALERAMREHQVDIVTHFAADIQVNESVTNPSKYYENNLKNTGIILEAMRKAGVRSIVFSSSAAVYGDPGEKVPIGEGDAKKPTSPYGWTKLLMEGLIQEYVGRHGFNAVALRYFNAAGAFVNMLDGQGEAFGESFGTDRGYDRARPSHIIPIFAGKMLKGEDITIFGEDYKTPDGTALRDYIHIFDLSIAHALAAKRLQETSRPGAGQAGAYLAVNLGTGVKVSNLEIAQKVAVAVSQATGRPYDQAKIGKGPRRAGDPQTLMASTGLAEKELGFKPQIGIDEIIATDVKWRVTHPEGYAEPTAPEKNEPGPRVRIRSILDWLDTVSGQGESTTIIGPEFAHRLLEQIRRDEIAKYREIKKDVFKEASEDRILSWIRDHDKDLSDALADLDAVLAKLKAPLATAYGRHYDLFNRIDALMGRMERLEASPHYAAAIRAAFLNKEFLKTQLKKARAVLDTRNHVMESYQAGEIGWLERNLESGNFLAQTLKDNVKALTNAVTKLEAEAAVRRAATSVPRFGWNKVIALAAGIWTFVFPGAAELKKQTATSPAVEREALLQKLRRQIQVDSTALDDVLSAIPGPDTRDAILKAVYDFAGPQPSAEQLNQVADWISGIDFKFRRLPEDASSFLKAGEASDRWLRALELMSGFGNFRAIWEQETAHAGVSGEWFGSYDASQPKRWHRVHLIPADVDGSVFKNPLYRGFRGDIEKFVDAPAGLLLLPPSKPLRRQASTRRVTRAEAGSERTEMRSMQSASSTSRVSDLAGPRTEMRGLWDAIRSSGVVRHALNDYRLVEIRDAASPKSSWRLVSSRTTIKPAAGQTISEHGWVAAKEAVRRLEVQAEIERGMNYFDFVDEKLQPQMRSLAAAVLRGDSWDMMRVERDLWGWTYLRRDKEVERILLLAEAHRNHRDDLTSRLVRWDKDETPEGLVQELGVYQSNFQYLLWDTLVRMGGKAIPAVWAEIQRLQPELIRRKLSPSGRDDDGVPVDEAMEDRMDAQLRFLVLVDLLSAMGDSSVLLAMISALQFRDTDTEYSHLEPTDIARYLVRFGAIAFERVEQAVTSGESDMFGTLLVSVWQQMKLMQPGAPTLAQGTLKAVQLTPEELSRQLKPGDTYSGYLNIEDNPLPQPIVVRRLTAKSYLILREVRTAPGEKETHMAVSFEEMPVDGGAYVKTGDRSVMNASNDAQFFKMAGAVMEAMGRVVTPALLTEDGNPMLRPLEAAQLIQEGREWWNARLEASERLEMRIDDAARKTRTPLQLDRQLKPGQTFSGFLEVEKEQRPWPAVVHRVAKDIYLVVREERDAKGARETRIGVSMGQVLIEASVEIIADLDLLENAGSEAQFFQAASAVIEGMAMAILEANPLRNPYANILLRGDEGVRIKDLGVDLWRIALSQPARPELRTGDTDPVLAAAETAEFFGFSERHHVPQHFSIRLDGKRYSFLLEVLDEGPGVSEFIYSGREDKLSWTGPLKVTVNPADHAFVSATHEQQMSAPIFDRIEAVLNSAAFRERWNAYEHSQAALETEPEKPRAEMRAAKTLPFGLGRTLTMEERAAAVIEVHSGGEGPGVNAFVAAVTAAREAAGKKTYGVKNGIKGLLGGGPLEENLVYLDEGMRKKIRLRGGSALGTSRVSLKTPDLSRDIRTILAENNTDAVNVEKVFKWAKSKLLTVLTDKAKVLGHIRGFEGIRAIGGGDHSEVWALLAEEGDKPRDERFKAFGELLVYLDATGKTELAAQLRGAIEALNNLYDDSEVRKPLHHTIVIYKTIDGDTVGQAEGFDSAVLTALRTIYWHIQSALDMDKQPAVVLGIMGRDVMRLAFEAARHHPRILQKLRDTSVVDQFRAYVERIDGLDALNPDLPELKSVLEELEYQKGLDLALADQIEEFAPYVLTIGQADADFYLPLQGVLNRVEQVWSEQGFFALIVSEGFSINENDPVLRDLIDPQSENYDTAIATLWWQMRESAKDLDAHGNPKLSGVEQLVRAIILAKLGPKLGKSIRDAEKIGYETRGGAVSKLDLMLGELLGAAAEKFAAQGQYGVLSIPDHSAPIPANLRLESFQNLLSRRRQTATKFNNVRNPDLYAGETFGGQPITKDNIDAFLESEGVILRDPGPYVPRGQAGVRPEMRRSSMPALRDRVRASEAWAVRVLPPEVVRFLERVWSSGGGVGIRMQTEVESLLGVRLAFAAEQAVRLPANARQIRLSQTVPVLEGGQAILAGEWPAAYQQDLQAFYNLQHRLRENRKSARDKRPVMAFVADRDIFVAGLEEAVANLKDRSLDAAEIEELRELWSGSGAPGEVRLEDLITFVHPSELKAYAAGRGAAVLHSDDSEAVEGVNLVIKPEKLKREVGDGRMVTALLSHLPFSSVSASVAARGEEPLAAADKLRKGPFEALSLTVNGRMIELTGGWNTYLQNVLESHQVIAQAA